MASLFIREIALRTESGDERALAEQQDTTAAVDQELATSSRTAGR